MSGADRHRLSSLHDVELATLAAAGARMAFGELVRRHGSAVRALLRRMGAQPSEAVADFRGEGTFAGWVKKIAARTYVRRLNKERRLRLLLEDSQEDEAVRAPDHGSRLDLDDAMKGLAEAERICVTFCYGAGLSHAEAAEALNLPLGTVKSHVKRGLVKLRARLAPEAGTPAGRRGNG